MYRVSTYALDNPPNISFGSIRGVKLFFKKVFGKSIKMV